MKALEDLATEAEEHAEEAGRANKASRNQFMQKKKFLQKKSMGTSRVCHDAPRPGTLHPALALTLCLMLIRRL